MTSDLDLARASVFLDFDGTVTTLDVGDHVADRLAPAGWRAVDDRYLSGEIGSRECLLEVWELLPHDEATLCGMAREVPVDPGLEPLVAGLRSAGAEVLVISDGFGFTIDEVCRPLGLRYVSNRVDWSTGCLEFPYEDRCCPCSSCGTCKQAPLKDARRRGRATVLVGDGASDRKAALLADMVLAKGELAAWCERAGVDCRRFETLEDVRMALVPS